MLILEYIGIYFFANDQFVNSISAFSICIYIKKKQKLIFIEYSQNIGLLLNTFLQQIIHL